MIKLQPNTFTSDLLSITNPRGQVVDQEGGRQNKINELLKGQQKPLNAPNVISQRIDILNLGGFLQIYSASPNVQTGIWALGNNYGNAYLQSPTAYKLSNVNDINLRINVSFQQLVNFSFAPTPDGSYSVMYYIVLANQPQGLNTTDDWYLVIPFQFNYDDALEKFSFAQPTQTFRLKETIDSRERVNIFGTSYPDFNFDFTKITKTQYEQLATQDVTVNMGGGFDLGQIDPTTFPNSTPNTPLSSNNQAHFEYFLYGNTVPVDNQTYLNIVAVAVFTYSGLFANYTPVDNA
jgi:hypothetical protein